MTKRDFDIYGMKCVNCKANVEKAIKALDGVFDAIANLEDAKVTVDYDEHKVTPQAMKDAVENIGRFEMII